MCSVGWDRQGLGEDAPGRGDGGGRDCWWEPGAGGELSFWRDGGGGGGFGQFDCCWCWCSEDDSGEAVFWRGEGGGWGQCGGGADAFGY